MSTMDRFDDVSVVASVDESPPPPRVPRRARRLRATDGVRGEPMRRMCSLEAVGILK